MIQSIKNYPVNWIDGMKISKDHLIKQENFVLDLVRDSNSVFINQYNYGIIPAFDEQYNRSILEINITATEDAELIIKKCSAITIIGHRIELENQTINFRKLVNNLNNEVNSDIEYYVIASVNLFEKIPFGEIDPNEIPPRNPYTKPSYKIELIEVSTIRGSLSGGNYLILGNVIINSGTVGANLDYIPPCTSIMSHPKLVEYNNSLFSLYGNIRKNALNIIQKEANKKQNTALANNIKALCKIIVNHVSTNYFKLRNTITSLPPIYLVETYSQLGLYLHNEIKMILTSEVEEMLGYCFEWTEIAPHTLKNALAVVADLKYDHINSGESLTQIDKLFNILNLIFSKLNELDYLGQRKENIIVNEQEVIIKKDNYQGWSVID